MLSAGHEANQSQAAHESPPAVPYLPVESAYGDARLGRRWRADALSAPAARERIALRPALGAFWRARGVWLGLAAGVIALWGTLLVADESRRTDGEWLLTAAGVLGIVAWGGQKWTSPFAPMTTARSRFRWTRRHTISLSLFALGALTVWLADTTFLAHRTETFGAAGWLWLLSMALLLAAALLWPREATTYEDTPAPPAVGYRPLNTSTLPVRRVAYDSPEICTIQRSDVTAWTLWEIATLVGIMLLALVLRLWDLQNIPFPVNYDEINTGREAHNYIGGLYPSVFSTVWEGIELPGLWFSFVAASLNVLGTNLAAVRVPAALFGAATVLPFYGIVRSAWGRTAALAGATILAFSAADIHYSRSTLNNIVTPFFWAVCFFFVLRGLRTRRPVDWLVAGLAGGLSEYFYYGTRLLPYVLGAFAIYLLIIHWRQGWRYLGHFALVALGYLAAFGPLLAYYTTRPELYLGRVHESGALKWDHIPTSLDDLQRMWNVLWPLMSDNLLGISTKPSSDGVYAGPLLMQAEAALLVLGFALLIFRWRQPAAFLTLLAGVGVLFAGGTLINGTPFIAHWTPAFPAFYAAIALPIGAWAAAGAKLSERLRTFMPIALAVGLLALGAINAYYYFHLYKARPLEEARAAQDRAQAALGVNYRVFDVGPSAQGWDVESMQYFVHGQEGANLIHPETDLPVPPERGKGLAFFFFTDNEQYRPMVRRIYPGGIDGSVASQDGTHLFYTYILTPEQVAALSP